MLTWPRRVIPEHCRAMRPHLVRMCRSEEDCEEFVSNLPRSAKPHDKFPNKPLNYLFAMTNKPIALRVAVSVGGLKGHLRLGYPHSLRSSDSGIGDCQRLEACGRRARFSTNTADPKVVGIEASASLNDRPHILAAVVRPAGLRESYSAGGPAEPSNPARHIPGPDDVAATPTTGLMPSRWLGMVNGLRSAGAPYLEFIKLSSFPP